MSIKDDTPLYVTSHVGRDLLQSAALFKSEALVVWEYVSNSLQYVDPGRSPEVRVHLEERARRIRIFDNGAGMDWPGLQQFFVMHGENAQRRVGRAGRGMFGTGKSAAFGIADSLRVNTTRAGKRSVVVLKRADIVGMASGDPIPVRAVEREVRTSDPNGTEIAIENVRPGRIDQGKIIRYLEQHLARWQDRGAQVFVNNRLCEVMEPEISDERRFRADPVVFPLLGSAELRLRVTRAPLDEESWGVSIYSNGNWHETTLIGAEGKEGSEYITGEIDVPGLEVDASVPPAFDMSRAMKLNPENRIVRSIYQFIGPRIEELRKTIAAAERQRRETEEARKLAKQAEEIAALLNDDFQEFRRQVTAARGRASVVPGKTSIDPLEGEPAGTLTAGGLIPGEEISPVGGPGADGSNGGHGREARQLGSVLEPDTRGASKGSPAGTSPRRGGGGGFRVRFENVGASERRAKYVEAERTIVVNLDHPQIAAARGSGTIEQESFRRLGLEVALTEYAVALAQLLAGSDELVEPAEALFHVRDTIDRMSRKASRLFLPGIR